MTVENKQPSILERKLRKILDSGAENDPKIRSALTELSTFFEENSLKSRRNLRGEIERRSLSVNSDFVSALEDVKKIADTLAADVAHVDEDIIKMEADLTETESKTRDLTSKIAGYREESSVLEARSIVLERFEENFELPESVVSALTNSSEGNIDSDFFQGLERLKRIRKDCEGALLRTGGETALEIMEKMSGIQESALEKLYRWTTATLRNKNYTDFISLEDRKRPHLSTAMKYLQERPVLFKVVLTEYGNSRKSVLVKSFIDALTIGGPGGTPRPIELHAHDPLRYVGDMLAWLHQTAPSESENARSLLKLCDQVDVESSCREVLSVITEGVCRPLENRTEQVVLSEKNPVVLFRLANLMRFYSGTFEPVMRSSESSLMLTLKELDVLCYNQFMSTLNYNITAMTTSDLAPPSASDLLPSQSTLSLMTLLKDILSSSTVIEDQERQFAQIVDAVIDPLVKSLIHSVSGFPTTDQDVYILNSVYHINSTLSLFQFNDSKLKALQSEMDMRLDTLTSEQASHLIAFLGLQPICTLLSKQTMRGGEELPQLSKVEGMDSESLSVFVERFDDFLAAPDAFLLPQIRLLTSSSHRKIVNQRPLSVVIASYKQLYEAIIDPNNGYSNPKEILARTPEEVSALLQM